jgi:dienelactone hydrolase
MIKKIMKYYDHNIELEGFAACSSEEKCPLVLLCHAWRGRDNFICEKAEWVARLGYAGVAIDMYGKGILGTSQEENAALKRPFIEDRFLLQQRLLKGFDAACALPYVNIHRIAVIGFGFGALCALDLARSGVNLKGAVSVYGHFDPPHNFSPHPIQAKVLILHGYNDPVVPMDELKNFQEKMEREKVDWQAHVYGNTFHAFATPMANDREAGILYNSSSAKRADDAIVNFLQEIFDKDEGQ